MALKSGPVIQVLPSTYASLLTPPGSGAIAVIRVVGDDSITLVNRIFRPARGQPLSIVEPNRLRYGTVVDSGRQFGAHSPAEYETIDDVVACVVARNKPAPSGEPEPPFVELCTHGGVRVIERVLQLLERNGAPISSEGSETTMGLFENRAATVRERGKAAAPTGIETPTELLDWPCNSLLERDVDEQLLLAKTERAVRFLAHQRSILPRTIKSLGDLVADHPERTIDSLRSMIEHYDTARVLIEGAIVAIVGPPNSGKSTLFNRLVGRNAAIVSPTAGTTRDWIEADVEIDGVPVTLLDTAGEHDTADELEQAAIDVGRRIGGAAFLALLVLDRSASLPTRYLQGWSATSGTRCSKMLLIANKCDRPATWSPGNVLRQLKTSGPTQSAPFALRTTDNLVISAHSGENVGKVIHRVADCLGLSNWNHHDPCVFTIRQRRGISNILSFPITDVAGMRNGLLELVGNFA